MLSGAVPGDGVDIDSLVQVYFAAALEHNQRIGSCFVTMSLG
jgi:hypothetical protein